MRVEMRALLATCFMAVTLAGCGTDDSILGGGKDAPDEFAIVTKQPLVIPPDFNLHPPRPGSPPTNQISPSDAAQAALFSDDPAQIAATMPDTYSPAEKMLLAKTGAASASDSIRQVIAADNKNLEAADTGFTSSLLFGGSDTADEDGTPLDADAERARLGSRVTEGQGRPVADAAPMPTQTIAPAYAPPTGAPAVSGALPPVGAAQAPPRSMPIVAPAPMASEPAPAQTASTPTYYAPPGPAVAGTLPPIGGDSDAAPARPSRPARKSHKDDSGWFDGIF